MHEEYNFAIRLATIEDLPSIMALHKKYLYGNLNAAEQLKGFIRVCYTAGEINVIINHKEIVIAVNENEIIGYYLIGKKSSSTALIYQKDQAILLANALNISIDNIAFGCQICINEEYRKNGLYNLMLQDLLQLVKIKYDYLFCSISQENIISMKTHLNNKWMKFSNINQTEFLTYKIVK